MKSEKRQLFQEKVNEIRKKWWKTGENVNVFSMKFNVLSDCFLHQSYLQEPVRRFRSHDSH